MTKLLNLAIAKLQTLPALEQDAIASIILEELEEDISWEKYFVDCQGLIGNIESSARDEYPPIKMQ